MEPEILRWFDGQHLPAHLRPISALYSEMARLIVVNAPKPSAERTVALRKLLESKDAAVRAVIEAVESDMMLGPRTAPDPRMQTRRDETPDPRMQTRRDEAREADQAKLG